MKILVLNCGSSSIKYQLFDMKKEEVLAKGIVDKIAMKGASLTNKRIDGDKAYLEGEIIDHQAGIEYILGVLISKEHGSLKEISEIQAVGHRVAHGGESFNKSEFVNDNTIYEIEKCIELAPLHNPANLNGILAMKNLLPDLPQVATFDTAFHQSMPDYSYMYAIPYSLYKKYGIRRYGFHGTSHKFVAQRACELLGKNFEEQKIITCHLGNGASIAAIKNGKSMDTSMGLTPVEGLMMGTRTGDLDAGALTYIMSKEEIGVQTANTLINKHSGVLGVSGVSSDMRELENASKKGNERAKLALKMYYHRVKKYVGAYAAIMEGVNILIFTGGIGENDDNLREKISHSLSFAGLKFDTEKNKGVRSKDMIISKENSKIITMIIPTNEEFVIAKDTFDIVKNIL
ncbi:MAG: acetate kinase [Bacteroidetes bacterium 4572_128]|nr:MAG: acetate kinase [Bacteroidetes bacterium 4572_128]